MEMVAKGYNGVEYSLEELKHLCLKCHTKSEIEADTDLKSELERRKTYHSKIYNSKISDFPDEVWKDLRDVKDLTKYSVSNKGRVKFKGKLISQDDEARTYGYLVLDPENNYAGVSHSVHVYRLVAYAFLGLKPGDEKQRHVHHIDNNGYDCRPENLILLTAEQHSFVHGFPCGKYEE